MPIYEYRCEACERRFERLIPFAERDTAQSCPTCASSKTRVLVSSFAFAGMDSGDATEASFSGGGCCGGACGCGCSAN
jgi:putative FmdB family regulatory protein